MRNHHLACSHWHTVYYIFPYIHTLHRLYWSIYIYITNSRAIVFLLSVIHHYSDTLSDWMKIESSPSPSGQVLLLQADGFWLTVRTLLDSCHSQSMQTGSEAITHSWEIMATKDNTWSVSTFAGSEYTPQNNSTSWKTIHHLLFNHGVNDSVNVICLSQTTMPYI